MELRTVAADTDGIGALLIVDQEDDTGEGWLFNPELGVATLVSVASLYSRDPYLWRPETGPPPAEAVAAIKRSS
jgi:hypothetical protein